MTLNTLEKYFSMIKFWIINYREISQPHLRKIVDYHDILNFKIYIV